MCSRSRCGLQGVRLAWLARGDASLCLGARRGQDYPLPPPWVSISPSSPLPPSPGIARGDASWCLGGSGGPSGSVRPLGRESPRACPANKFIRIHKMFMIFIKIFNAYEGVCPTRARKQPLLPRCLGRCAPARGGTRRTAAVLQRLADLSPEYSTMNPQATLKLLLVAVLEASAERCDCDWSDHSTLMHR